MISLHLDVDLDSTDTDYRDKEVLYCTWLTLFWWMGKICFLFQPSFDLRVCEREKENEWFKLDFNLISQWTSLTDTEEDE